MAEAIQAKVGIDNSAVSTSHDYLLKHLPAQASAWYSGAAIDVESLNTTTLTRGTVSDTEFSYLDGVTSGIQNQLNLKALDSVVLKKDGSVPLTGAWDSGNAILAESLNATTITTGLMTIIYGSAILDDLVATSISVASLTRGSVSDTEFGYLDGVGTAIQTELDTKASNVMVLKKDGSVPLTTSWDAGNSISAESLTATTIAGILSGNLLDKTAGAKISADWTFSMADITYGSAILNNIEATAGTIKSGSFTGDIEGIYGSAILNNLQATSAIIYAGSFTGDIEAIYGSAILNNLDATSITIAGGAIVSDVVYGAGWDTDATHAPSKNAVYDKIQTLAGGGDMLKSTYDVDTDNDIDPEAGGTGLNTGALTGIPKVTAGTWSINATQDNLGDGATYKQYNPGLVNIIYGSAILDDLQTTSATIGSGSFTGDIEAIYGSAILNNLSASSFTTNLINIIYGSAILDDLQTTSITIGGTTTTNDLTINQQAYFDAEVSLGNLITTTLSVNWTQGNKQSVSLAGTSACVTSFTNPTGPCNLLLKILQGASTTGEIEDWTPGAILWSGATTPTISASAGSADVIGFYFDGGGSFYAVPSLDFA